jgi:hypothetical protein
VIFFLVALKPATRLGMGIDTHMYHKTTSGAILGRIELPKASKTLPKLYFIINIKMLAFNLFKFRNNWYENKTGMKLAAKVNNPECCRYLLSLDKMLF